MILTPKKSTCEMFFAKLFEISETAKAIHLQQKSKNGLKDSEVEWNFQKYLLNEKGELEKVISPKTLPTDPEVVNWIKG